MSLDVSDLKDAFIESVLTSGKEFLENASAEVKEYVKVCMNDVAVESAMLAQAYKNNDSAEIERRTKNIAFIKGNIEGALRRLPIAAEHAFSLKTLLGSVADIALKLAPKVLPGLLV